MKHLKSCVIAWAKERWRVSELELHSIKDQLASIHVNSISQWGEAKVVEELRLLESRRHSLFLEQENSWRLKSRVIWMEAGDQNTIFFIGLPITGKTNSIWDLEDDDKNLVLGFKNISSLGLNHFKGIFKELEHIRMDYVLK